MKQHEELKNRMREEAEERKKLQQILINEENLKKQRQLEQKRYLREI